MDFKKMLSPDARRRLEQHKADVRRFAQMSDAELERAAEHCYKNCGQPRWRPGEPVYDATMWHVIIPELIARLAFEREKNGVSCGD